MELGSGSQPVCICKSKIHIDRDIIEGTIYKSDPNSHMRKINLILLSHVRLQRDKSRCHGSLQT